MEICVLMNPLEFELFLICALIPERAVAGLTVNLPTHGDFVGNLFISYDSVALSERLCGRDVACILESCVNMSVPCFFVTQSLGCHTVFVLSLSPTDVFPPEISDRTVAFCALHQNKRESANKFL